MEEEKSLVERIKDFSELINDLGIPEKIKKMF